MGIPPYVSSVPLPFTSSPASRVPLGAAVQRAVGSSRKSLLLCLLHPARRPGGISCLLLLDRRVGAPYSQRVGLKRLPVPASTPVCWSRRGPPRTTSRGCFFFSRRRSPTYSIHAADVATPWRPGSCCRAADLFSRGSNTHLRATIQRELDAGGIGGTLRADVFAWRPLSRKALN